MAQLWFRYYWNLFVYKMGATSSIVPPMLPSQIILLRKMMAEWPKKNALLKAQAMEGRKQFENRFTSPLVQKLLSGVNQNP
jgi:hypothetical protein